MSKTMRAFKNARTKHMMHICKRTEDFLSELNGDFITFTPKEIKEVVSLYVNDRRFLTHIQSLAAVRTFYKGLKQS